MKHINNFATFFKAATGHERPHEYQVRLACGERNNASASEWHQCGISCTSHLISVPTGMGKTAAVTLAWLWNRVLRGDESWPRRLIYCLPMRTLVEQTHAEIGQWLGNLAKAYPDNTELAWLVEYSPVILMGGEENNAARREWDIYPEKPAIIIGTQDMLLSRALNRGYGMARARWPMHFALLNNDCLWIMDETQLMDVGLATSAQLQSFRATNTDTWWMSATMQAEWLRSPETSSLLPALIEGTVTSAVPQGITKSLKLIDATDEKGIAALVGATANSLRHTTTLIIVNTVKRAVAVYGALKKDKSLAEISDIYLAHSRFRPIDRQSWRETFLSRNIALTRSRIIVATQVVEAGVDISADTLITEIAPWTSLIQRFGRAARYGGTSDVVVIDVDEKTALPYDYAEIEAAREELRQLEDVSIEALAQHDAALTSDQRAALYPYAPNFLLLQHEINELFDTSADLSGADIDVSRFIRTGEDTDCQIAWVADAPTSDYRPATAELCPVPIRDAHKFTKKHKNAVWHWDYLDRVWQPANEENVYPGMIMVALTTTGGYSQERGFSGEGKEAVPVVSVPGVVQNADAAEEDESLSEMPNWQTIAEHGMITTKVAEEILGILNVDNADHIALLHAARYHDIGKAHPAFQSLLKVEAIPGRLSGVVAKAPSDAWIKPARYKIGDNDVRPGFRHELASALALLLNQDKLASMAVDDFNLLLYLVASHHGKVRVSLQASPHDQKHPVTRSGGKMPVRGVLEGDVLPAILDLPDTQLVLAPASIGLSPITGESWTARVLRLLAHYGPFRLAYLEALLRAADARASKSADSTVVSPTQDIDAAPHPLPAATDAAHYSLPADIDAAPHPLPPDIDAAHYPLPADIDAAQRSQSAKESSTL